MAKVWNTCHTRRSIMCPIVAFFPIPMKIVQLCYIVVIVGEARCVLSSLLYKYFDWGTIATLCDGFCGGCNFHHCMYMYAEFHSSPIHASVTFSSRYSIVQNWPIFKIESKKCWWDFYTTLTICTSDTTILTWKERNMEDITKRLKMHKRLQNLMRIRFTLSCFTHQYDIKPIKICTKQLSLMYKSV